MRVTCYCGERRVVIRVAVAAHDVHAPGSGRCQRHEQIEMLASQEVVDAFRTRQTPGIGERRTVLRILESRRFVRLREDILAEELQLVGRVSIEGDELLEGACFDGARRPSEI